MSSSQSPSRRSRRVMTNVLVMFGRTAMRMIIPMIGTAVTPLSTSAQMSARIGWIGGKSMPAPISVANAMIA